MKTSFYSSLLVVAVSSLNMACSSSAAVQAANKGDYAALKQHLAEGLKAGSIDGGEARAVAEAVAHYEINKATGADAVTRVNELKACSAPVQGLLEERSEKGDEGAARAALLLLDDRLSRPSKWREKASDEAPHWRAVGARALTDQDQGEQRRALFGDLFADVRKAAFRASLDAADPGDLPMLLEAVRVDPEEEVRSTAARGAGTLGGEDTVRALKDRWFSSSEPVRSSIIRAWGSQASYQVGGRDQLLWAAESDRSTGSLLAAVVLLRGAENDAAVGRMAMLRALGDGPAPSRVMALNLANLADEPQKQAVIKASESGEGAVKVAALSRLTEIPELKQKALDELGTIAAGDSRDRNAARTALARARDRRVVQLLADDTRASEAGVRAWASGELASMKEFPHAAQVLADDDVSVRVRAACSILAMPR